MAERSWMYVLNRTCDEFLKGVLDFIAVAEEDMKKNEKTAMCYPCYDCNNIKKFPHSRHIHAHLIMRGFKKNYLVWNKHGEEGDNPNEMCQNGKDGCIDEETPQGHADDQQLTDEDIVSLSDDYADIIENVDQMVLDAEGNDGYTNGEFAKFQELVLDSKKLLYPACNNKFTWLYSVLKLLQLKAAHCWSDRSFNALLLLLRDMLPEPNELPRNTYEAKKIICPLGLEVEKIHACKEDCMLYRGEYAHLTHCPYCGTSRYKPRKDGGDDAVASKRNGPPRKVVWYFPIIPRLKRLFANAKEAELLRWHKEGRNNKDGYIRHPADATQWRNIENRYKKFAKEIRNIRFALSTDGMNPFGDMSSAHSTWPVVLSIYNLPPWLCNKRKYIMLTVLISGPKQPGINIDAYFRPLVDDLKILWSDGVEVWDQFKREYFKLHAMLFCTIQDLPALYAVSGQIKGAKGCPECLDDTESIWLRNSKKTVYMRHRRFLHKSHAYRSMKSQFDGTKEMGSAPRHFRGEDIHFQVNQIDSIHGKRKRGAKGGEKQLWKKKSIFWELEYWEILDVRHCIDLMHIKKNLHDSLVGTFLNMKGKTKDHANARADLKEMGLRPELCRKGNDEDLPTSCITLSKKEKKELCEFFSSVKVPSGYSGNIGKLFSVTEMKWVGKTKTHNCDILLTALLPVGIRNILPVKVREAIMSLCFFLNAISQKVIDPNELDDLQSNLIKTLCHLEMFFPPSFFDMMVHLTAHLVKEVFYLGPVYLHQMYPYERYLAVLKSYVRNPSSPEGCIAEGYSTEEVVEWCMNYIDPEEPIGVPKSPHEGRLAGKGTLGQKAITPDLKSYEQAHFVVLQHMNEVSDYIAEHKQLLLEENPERNEAWVAWQHMKKFNIWFRDRIAQSTTKNSDLIRKLAAGPVFTIVTYQGYEINGYTFYTIAQDKKSIHQNCSVRIDAYENDLQTKSSYYGQIEEIWELNYGTFNVPLFKCLWVQGTRGVQRDNYGFTTVKLDHLGFKEEPFVLAKDVTQVFYVPDTCSKKRRVVLPGKRQIVGVENVVDEEEFNQFDEIPPFATSIISEVLPSEKTLYLGADHKEGVRVPKCQKTK